MSIAGVNYLNIGLMVASLGAALALPFETFLFSYAVLGPLHYLTEMSWLHDRNYFVPRRSQVMPIAALAVVSLISGSVFPELTKLLTGGDHQSLASWNAESVFAALALSLVFVLAKGARARAIGIVVVVGAVFAGHYLNAYWRGLSYPAEIVNAGPYRAASPYDVFFMVFLTTIIHVFVFTAAFLLYGALKSESRSGYLSVFVLVACALLCFLVPVSGPPELSDYVRRSYDQTSTTLDILLVEYGGSPLPKSPDAVFGSESGIMIGRLIAYSYTYHYLNWFSKTSIIKWHAVSRSRLVAVAVIWIASLILYGIEYRIGLQWLFLLSMLHVFLEFPLNWRSFFGIFAELKKRALSA